ncbi:MAG: hypothetical protein KatS3mg057_2236 [Herpetosiphonaceae bacterium]|nr:MAG: hypothetical protein KatS3mg057_2236 [Herpetosiphonaceae bacterium]
MSELSDRIAALSPKKRALLEKIRQEKASARHTIKPQERPAAIPLSFAQQRLWFLDQLIPGSPAYNIPLAMRFKGPLDCRALEQGLNAVVERHEILRTTFGSLNGEPFQIIHPHRDTPLPVIDLQHLPPEEREAAARRLLEEEASRPFDLAAGPLLRAQILRLGPDEHIFQATMHHIISDGWSMGIFIREFFELSDAAAHGRPPQLPPLPIQYADYALWQRRWLESGALASHQDYWIEQLAGAPTLLELPTDRPRPSIQTFHGARYHFKLPKPLASSLVALSREEDATLFMTLLAAFQVLLSRLSGQTDLVVGSPIANRTRVETEGLIGFFVNTLALRAKLGDDPDFRTFLRRVRETTLGAFAHQDVPFEHLVELLQPERSTSHSPLFQVMFVLQNALMTRLGHAQLSLEPVEIYKNTAKFDLTLSLEETADGIQGEIEYNSDLFDPPTIERMAGHFRTLLEGIIAQPDTRISRLPLLTLAEQQLLVSTWNDTRAPLDTALAAHQLFELQAARTPDALAVVCEEHALTFAQLDARANQLAHYLATLGVGPDVPVALCLQRSPELLIALLAVLKAGGAYLPLDPSYPAERLAFMLHDARPAVVLTTHALAQQLPPSPARLLCLDLEAEAIAHQPASALVRTPHPAQLAYIIYTSGSTGKPKGTLITQRGLSNYLLWAVQAYEAAAGAGAPVHSPLGFDLTVTSLYTPLLAGRPVVLVREAPGADGLREVLERAGPFSLVKLTPAHLDVLRASLPAQAAANARLLVIGGEALYGESLRWWRAQAPQIRLVNEYGPTETVVGCCVYEVPEGQPVGGAVPIGRPIANMRMYVLDSQLQPVPVGVVGELYIGGVGVGRGYLNRPDLTAERFVPEPWGGEPGARMYRTGDLGRWRADGVLEYLGRVDQQIKLRGFRVELGEIEATLAAHPAVREAVVVAHKDSGGDTRLVAYVVGEEGRTPAQHELLAFLKQTLPEYMLPAAFVFLEALPLTANGKVDRRALPAPGLARPDLARPYVAPRSDTEQILAAIWQELLGIEQAGLDDNFFELGGHSLIATRLISRVRDVFQVELPLHTVFAAPTLAAFATEIERSRAGDHDADTSPIPIGRRDGPLPLSFSQRRLWFIEQLAPGTPMYNIPHAIRLRGTIDAGVLEQALNTIVQRHAILRATFAMVDGEPRQYIAPELNLPLPIVDLQDLPEEPREAEASRLVRQEAQQPFDLSAGPLIRATLLRLADDDHILLVTMHHIVSDGWSMGIFVQELAQLSQAIAAGRPAPLPDLPIQYTDYAQWQVEWFQGEVQQQQLDYWRAQLEDAPTLLELPTDRPRPQVQSWRGASHPFTIAPATAAALSRFTQQEGATIFMTLLAAFQLLLHRYSGQDDIVVGVPVANRTRSEVEGLIGFFVNTLALRVDLSGNPSFRELLSRVRETSLGAFSHQDIPFEQLVEELRPERSLSHSPLFQVMFALQNAPQPRIELPDLMVEPFAVETIVAKFDLTLAMETTQEGLRGTFTYNTDLFNAATIESMCAHFTALLDAIVADPGRPIGRLPLLSDAERQQLLVDWNATALSPDSPLLAHQLVERQVLEQPDALAIASAERQLSYQELNQRANQLAHYLIALGAGPETCVALCLERSPELIIGALAALKAGAAYLPIDPAVPQERLEWMLADADAPILLSRRRLLARPPEDLAEIVDLDEDWAHIAQYNAENPAIPVSEHNLAYVIYTSGSTGRPKGVAIEHQGLRNLIAWHRRAFALSAADRTTLLASPAFDASVWEIWPTLASGASLHIPDEEARMQPKELQRWLLGQQISVSFVPTPIAERLLELDWPPMAALRLLLTGGDALRRYPAANVPFVLVNNYGPTENSVVTTSGDVPALQSADAAPSIGRPIANTRVYVLDRYGEPVPVGVPGELSIGGIGLARGYLRRADLTAERFVPDAFSAEPGARLYRTGDLVRWLSDGNLEFLGRLDHQVKIRGFRIELGEIEALLRRHPAVREALVLARDGFAEGQDKRIVAYVVPMRPTSADELVDALRQRLPDYMIPTAFVLLDAFPLTSNGKIDRRALPAPDGSQLSRQYVAPRTATEQHLAAIWAEVLHTDRIGLYDNFFSLGGHSLLATQVIARIRDAFGADLPLRALFELPTVAALAQQIEATLAGQTGPRPAPIPPARRDQPLPLSFAQQRLWFLDQLIPNNPAYNIAGAVHIAGPLNAEAWERALNAIVQRHEALRTTFVAGEGEPVQVISESLQLHLPLVSLEALPPDEREAQLRALVLAESQQPFDLAHGPLIRGVLYRLGADEHVLFLSMHHIVSDGWSMGILIRELALLCQEFSGGEVARLTPLPIQYADYAAWQRAWFQSEEAARQLDYWRQQLAGAPTLLELPTDKPRPPVQSYRGATYNFRLPAELSQALAELSQGEQATLFMTLLAAFQTLLYRYSGQEDILVGSPIANRTRVELEGLIGFFVNTLVLRADLSGNPSFRQLLQRVRQTTLDAYAHQDTPFEHIVEVLQPERSTSHTPLFQVMFILQNTPMPAITTETVRIRPLELDGGAAKFDLTLAFEETPEGLRGSLEYASDLFEEATIRRMAMHYEMLLRAIVRNPDARVAQLELMDAAELQRVTREWNNTRTALDTALAAHQLFELQAARSPDALAVVCEEHALTFAQLDARANQLAHYLATLGVGPDVPVALCLQRSPELLIALLAVLKAGGAYLPLDPSYPAERLAFMLSDARPTVVLTTHALAPQLPPSPARLLCLDLEAEAIAHQPASALARTPHPAQLAYIIYTSGSTGKPKGTLITQRGLSNYLLWAVQAYEAAAGAGAPVHSPLGFDLTVTSLYTPLLAGRPVVLVREAPGAEGLREVLERTGPFSLVKLTPAHLDVLRASLPAQAAANTRLLVIGGEALYGESLRWWRAQAPQIRLVNEYGPTETVVGCCVYEVPEGQPVGGAVPIGRPIANMRMYVLDAQLQPVPVGVVGELYIGGVGVGRGYLNRPDLTAERFVPEPWAAEPGARMYRTGDLGRWRADGVLEYLGRVDQQIKLRGFRVELGEIEATLAAHPAVREAVVVLREDQTDTGYRHQRLVAYVVPEIGEALEAGELTAFLQRSLPEYMLPAAFVFLEALPLTANGKVDRRALPAPDGAQLAGQYVAPRDELERTLVRIWQNLLRVEPIGTGENFFALGGHSLMAVQLLAEIERAFGRKLPLASIFQRPTIGLLAELLRSDDEPAQATPLVPLQPRGVRPPLVIVHGAGGSAFLFYELASLLGDEQPVYGLQFPELEDGEVERTSIEELAARYIEALRTIQPKGPYYLAGWSVGGTIAYEMAQQLRRQRQKVARLLLLDAQAPDEHRTPPAAEQLLRDFCRDIGLNLERLPIRWKKLKQLEPTEQLRQVLEQAQSAGLPAPSLDLHQIEHRFAIFQAMVEAARFYKPVSYLGELILFRAANRLDGNSLAIGWRRRGALGWDNLATGGVRVHTIPGNHYSLFVQPHAAVLAEQLRNYLPD